MDCLTLRRKFAYANASSSTYEHFPVFNAGLSSSYDGWAKCKEKVLDPNQNVETRSHSKLKFTQLKDLFIKRV